jgi:RNA polymerase sigma factor (sigma-70 family)
LDAKITKWIKIVVMRTLREKNLHRLDISTLISAGNLGYSQALKRFDPERGVKFKTFAEYRIKGAVLDEVRKMIGDERCKTPRPRKVDDFDFSHLPEAASTQTIIESTIDFEKFMKHVPLDEREKEMLTCRVLGMNLREISHKFGFSESRASQLLTKIKREVYRWYRTDGRLNFDLVTHICPSCSGESCVSDHIDRFKCDVCDSDLMIVDGVPILAVTDDLSDLSGESLNVHGFD